MKLARVYPDAMGHFSLPPGSYGRDAGGVWWVRPPVAGAHADPLLEHAIGEHADGTISVSPSVLDTLSEVHGWVVRGEWRSIA